MRWNWDGEKTKKWLEPAMEMAYLSERWGSLGFRELLDSGCGPGRHGIYFARKGFSVTGLDQSADAVSYFRGWAAEEGLTVQGMEGDFFRMPFEDNSFDCVVDYNASYHTDSAGYFRAVAELRRVLRPGGEVYLTLLSRRDSNYLTALPEEKSDEFTVCKTGSAPHFYADRNSIETVFRGFSLALPPREVIAPGIESGRESVHFHLLLKKEG